LNTKTVGDSGRELPSKEFGIEKFKENPLEQRRPPREELENLKI